jgi:hypothetical protein
MFETIFIFMVTFSVLVAATEGIVVPVAEKTVEVTTEVVEQAIDYVTTEEPKE